ncbi:hypothetical protein CBR61_08455 [Porphyrobacter sp. CACIAM 03H1]|nr:hypothetical protein CBR61_08455 [Porphyrobacter sp. CACIAM 03H1]
MACSDGAVTRSTDGGIVGIGPVSRIKIDNQIAVTYRALDTYSTDINGFGGSSWSPSDKRPAPNEWFTRYSSPLQGELLLSRFNISFAAHGLENGSSLCFFAAGLPSKTLPTAGSVQYFGIVDGFGIINGVPKRFLYWQTNGTVPELIMNWARREGDLTFQLMARSDPFGQFEKNAVEPVGTITGRIRLDQPGTIALSGAGFTGTMTYAFVSDDKNVLGTGGAGAALVYELRRANGDFVYGSIALNANLM